MAVVTISSETNVVLTKGQNTVIIPARPGRRAASFQVQFPDLPVIAFGWCKLSGPAAVDDGFRFRSGETITISGGLPGAGATTDFYEGAVNVYWEGRTGNPASEPLTVICRIVELS